MSRTPRVVHVDDETHRLAVRGAIDRNTSMKHFVSGLIVDAIQQARPRYPACCSKAIVVRGECVCAELQRCPVHGDSHKGTHC